MGGMNLTTDPQSGRPKPTVTFSAEDIAEARADSIGISAKRNADGLTPLQQMGAQMEALGNTSTEISQHLGVRPTSVRRWRMDVNYKRAVMVERWQILGNATPQAAQVAIDTLESADPELRLKAALKLLELGGMGQVPALLIGKTQEESTIRVVLEGAPRPERPTDSEDDEDDDGAIEAEYTTTDADYDTGSVRDASDWERARQDGGG